MHDVEVRAVVVPFEGARALEALASPLPHLAALAVLSRRVSESESRRWLAAVGGHARAGGESGVALAGALTFYVASAVKPD